jgi:hypothetical protein
MSVEDQIHEIMLSEELQDSEKLDRLHALIPTDELEIDNLNKATPAQLRRLKEANGSQPSDTTDQAPNFCRAGIKGRPRDKTAY